MHAAAVDKKRSAAGIQYTLTRKAVKNVNLRIDREGAVWVSAPHSVPAAGVDEFVAGHRAWITQKQQQARQRMQQARALPPPDRQQALELFTQVSDRVYPLFRQVLGDRKPEIRVRQMKTRWGVCCPARRRITLALSLAAVPLPLVEYVVLHEYCHFVHPDHQKGFWALMEHHMPDARARRSALSRYPCGLPEAEDANSGQNMV